MPINWDLVLTFNCMNTIPQSKRLSYAATDTAGQLVFAVISTYLLYFYTDVYGIPVGIASTISGLLMVAKTLQAHHPLTITIAGTQYPSGIYRQSQRSDDLRGND